MNFINRQIFPLLAAAAASLPLTSCYTDFDPGIPSTPVVCVNSCAIAGQPLIVEVTRTWRRDQRPEDLRDLDITDARVEVTVNGTQLPLPRYTELRPGDMPDRYGNVIFRDHYAGYPTGYTPAPGDHIVISVHSDKYGDATGEVTVPDPVDIDNIDIVASGVTVTDHPDTFVNMGTDYFDDGRNIVSANTATVTGSCRLSIRFKDPADAVNYYKLAASAYRENPYIGLRGEIYTGGFDFSHEPLFTEHVGSLESIFSDTSGYTLFSDRQISGSSYTLRLFVDGIVYEYITGKTASSPADLPVGGASDIDGIDISLLTISESYYRHVISVWSANDGLPGILGSIGIGDVAWEASNVSTGAGVISAATPSTRRIRYSTIFNIP